MFEGGYSRSRRVSKGDAVRDVHLAIQRCTCISTAEMKRGRPRPAGAEAEGRGQRGWNAGGGGAVAAVDGRLSTAGDQKTQRLISSSRLSFPRQSLMSSGGAAVVTDELAKPHRPT